MKALTKEVDLCFPSMDKIPIEKSAISRTPAKVKAEERLEKNFRGPRFLSNAFGKVRSRYLGVSMGSCHDLCKYGHKHECEDDRKVAIFRRFMTNGIHSDDVQKHVRGLNVSDRMKSSGLRLKVSDKAEVLQAEKIAASENSSTIELKTPSLKNNKMPGQSVLQDSPNDKARLIKILNPSKKKKNQAIKPKFPPLSEPSPIKKDVLKQKNSPASAKITSDSGSDIFKDKAASYMKETIAFSALKLSNQRNHAASPKFQGERKHVPDGFAKSTIYLKSRFPRNLEGNLNGPRNLEGKVGKSFKMLGVGDKNFLYLQKSSLRSTKPAHNPINLKVRKFRNIEHAKEDAESNSCVDIHDFVHLKLEKKVMNVNNDSFCIEDDGYTSESSASVVTDSEIVDLKVKLKLSEGKLRRRTQSVQLDSNSTLPYKMKFKRGKVIELLPTETVGPRRLRFRNGRLIHDNSNSEGLKKIVRRREMGGVKAPGAEAHANSSEASAVMLKHQDPQKKKDVQALFNHVIEETASKLVEVRKSKVKALVGAFETVILLQETKAAHVI